MKLPSPVTFSLVFQSASIVHHKHSGFCCCGHIFPLLDWKTRDRSNLSQTHPILFVSEALLGGKGSSWHHCCPGNAPGRSFHVPIRELKQMTGAQPATQQHHLSLERGLANLQHSILTTWATTLHSLSWFDNMQCPTRLNLITHFAKPKGVATFPTIPWTTQYLTPLWFNVTWCANPASASQPW